MTRTLLLRATSSTLSRSNNSPFRAPRRTMSTLRPSTTRVIRTMAATVSSRTRARPTTRTPAACSHLQQANSTQEALVRIQGTRTRALSQLRCEIGVDRLLTHPSPTRWLPTCQAIRGTSSRGHLDLSSLSIHSTASNPRPCQARTAKDLAMEP